MFETLTPHLSARSHPGTSLTQQSFFHTFDFYHYDEYHEPEWRGIWEVVANHYQNQTLLF